MPAGDLITDDYQIELAALLMGVGTDYQLDGPIEGLGNPAAKTKDTDLAHADGAVAADGYQGVRVITAPIVIAVDSAADAMIALGTPCAGGGAMCSLVRLRPTTRGVP